MGEAPNVWEPFQFEPRYTDEEMRARREARTTQVQPPAPPCNDRPNRRERQLQDRLDRVIPIADWCRCGHCRLPQNAVTPMCQCCCEHPALDDKRGNDCIRLHADFQAVCLTPAVLHVLVNSMQEIRGYRINITGWTNRLYRLVAYRAYTYWIHQRLGRYNRKVIPACVVVAIRDRFPEEDPNAYVSYREADEVGEAWHL